MAASTSATTEVTSRKYIYKIAPSSPTPSLETSTDGDGTTPVLPPSELDTSSGFIHMSTASQILGTLKNFFPTKLEEQNVVYLLKVPLTSEAAGADKVLRWESADATVCGPREGEGLFPHLYFIEGGTTGKSRLSLRKNEIDSIQKLVSVHGAIGWDDHVQKLLSENWLV